MASWLQMGASIIAIGGAAVAVGAGEAEARSWKLMLSTKPGSGDTNSNILLAFNPLVADVMVGGTVRYRGMDLQNGGHVNAAGKLVSLPNDPAITEVRGFTSLGGMDTLSEFYNGQTLVIEVVEGSIGAGNTLSIFAAGDGTATVIDSDPASYRYEKAITDATTATGPILPTIGISSVANYNAAGGATILFYFKANEADAKDVANNPYKGWASGWRTWASHFDIQRGMDWMRVMENCATHTKDIAQVGDTCWGGSNWPWSADFDHQCQSPRSRQGVPIEAWLDLCERGATSGGGQSAWLSMPIWYNSAVRKVCRSYINPSLGNGTGTYYIDGTQFQRNLSDALFWLDPSWIDLSSVTVDTAPGNGTLDVSSISSNGMAVYNPREDGSAGTGDSTGGVAHSHTSGEVQEDITFAFDTITYDSETNEASTGASGTFTVPVRVVYWGDDGGNPYYLCRIKENQIWPLNKTFMSAAARWQSNAHEFVDRLVASGYSTSRALYIALGNETWNGAQPFVSDKNYCQGVANAYDSEWAAWQTSTGASTSLSRADGGIGILTAFFRKYVEDELTARGLSYNLKWVVDCQIAVAGSAAAMAQGHHFAWESIFGLSSAAAAAKMADFGVGGAYYPSGEYNNQRPADNITGLSGSASDTEVLDRFDGTAAGYNADSTDLDADVIAWNTGAQKLRNAAQHLAEEATARALVEAEGGFWAGAYEDGDHSNNDNISSTLRNSTRTNSAGQTFAEWELIQKQGARRAAIIEDYFDRRIAVQADTILCQYGGQYNKTFGEPWSTGWWMISPTAEVLKLREYGRLA